MCKHTRLRLKREKRYFNASLKERIQLLVLEMRRRGLSFDEQSMALILCSILYTLSSQGVEIDDEFVYNVAINIYDEVTEFGDESILLSDGLQVIVDEQLNLA